MASNLRQRAVVSSFICTPPQSPTGLTFALFRRSEKLSTYPGKWAVCSGSIEPTDTCSENAAKREILEETTLSDDDIFLLRRGKPFSLIDEKLKKEWTIHPFAWQLKPHSKPMELDREHTEYQFVKPEDLETFDHVPQLEIGMGRVLVNPELETALSVLRDDHESGAQLLASKALEFLLENVRGVELSKINSAEEFWREIRWRAWHLAKNGRPSMSSAIETSLLQSFRIARENWEMHGLEVEISSTPIPRLQYFLEGAILERKDALQRSLSTLSNHFVEFIEKDQGIREGGVPEITNIVTLSASGTITTSLTNLIRIHTKAGRKIKLTVLESRPKFEGVKVVNTLINSLNSEPEIIENLKIEIVSDASIASALEDAHYLLLGADKVLPDGSVSNKIGSQVAAIIASWKQSEQKSKCKVVALYQSDKITNSTYDREHTKVENNDPGEVTKNWPTGFTEEIMNAKRIGWQVEVRNVYFEWVPGNLVHTHVSEKGLLSLGDIERIGNETRELEESLFGDL